MPPKPKNKGGRPTDYRPEYCEQLIEHMAQGFSYQSFAGVIRKGVKTLYRWEEAHPEWLEAKEIAEAASRKWWDERGLDAVRGLCEGFNATVWVFTYKNRFGWRDKQELTGKDGEPIKANLEVTVTHVTRDTLKPNVG